MHFAGNKFDPMKTIGTTILFAFLSVMILAACKSKPSGGNERTASDFSLGIIHAGCRGSCPAFNIKVDNKGFASYEGRRAVEMMGMYTKTLSTKNFEAIINAYEQAKFFDFDDAYGDEVADIPAVITTVTMNGKTKRVNDVRNAPKELKDLEAKVEALIGMDGWNKAD